MKQGLINIHIISTNNLNGAMFPEKNSFNMYKAATYIKLARQSGHVILLNNGPFLTGSLISEYYASLKQYKRIPLITMMNILKYQATNISVQDFQSGAQYFNRAHAMSDFPFLSCNVLNDATKEPYFNTPYIIHEHQGIKIGIIALSEAEPIHSEDKIIGNSVQSIKTWMRYMYDKESPDFVIALHNGSLQDLCMDQDSLCTEGIHMMITTSMDGEHLVHDLTEMIHTPVEASLLHIKLVFKERTTSFELKHSTHEFIDTSRFQEDFMLKEVLYYEEKEFNQIKQKNP